MSHVEKVTASRSAMEKRYNFIIVYSRMRGGVHFYTIMFENYDHSLFPRDEGRKKHPSDGSFFPQNLVRSRPHWTPSRAI